MEHATCTGKDVIQANQGYWRKSINSTTIIECPRQESCLGGYVESDLAPTECTEGYTGLLCSNCAIVNGTKYQPLSNFQCTK